MTYRGTYKNGIVILDEPTNLPDGQRVQVDVDHEDAEKPPATALPTPQMQELLKILRYLEFGPERWLSQPRSLHLRHSQT